MSLTKTFLGYHSTDGGRVYRETITNSLWVNTYCDYCKSGTINGRLDVNTQVLDITAVSALNETIDLPGTDADYKVAVTGLHTIFENINWLTVSFDSPMETLHRTAVAIGQVDALASNLVAQGNDAIAALQQYVASSETLSPSDGTVSTYETGDTTAFHQQYNNSFYNAQHATIDTSVGLDWTNNYFVQVDPAVEGILQSADYTTTQGFNRATMTFYHKGAQPLVQDWTRGYTATLSFSNDGGVSWVAGKFLDATFSSSYYTYYRAGVEFPLNGSVFLWKLTFIDTGTHPQIVDGCWTDLYVETSDIRDLYMQDPYA